MSDDIIPGEPAAERKSDSEESDILDSSLSNARVNEEDRSMPIPLKPARNPRWEPARVQADEPDEERPYEQDVAEILSEIQNVAAVAQLESRVDSIEIDLARMRDAKQDSGPDEGTLAGELAAMKARVEEALHAVGATVSELKASAIAQSAPPIDETALTEKIRSARDDAIEAARTEAAARLKQIRSEVETQISTARAEFQSSFNGLLQGLESGLQAAREQASREIEKTRERFEPELRKLREEWGDEASGLRRDLTTTEETFSGALRAFASRLEGLQSQISESGARGAAERAAFNASVQGLAQRIDALDERMAEGLARLSEGILRVAESIGSATTLQRRIAALEALVPKSASE
ncbi:MAG: hypothetical protein ACYDCC_11665 [Actinomycetota bacterium]